MEMKTDIINHVLNSFRTNDTKLKMKNDQQKIIKLEKEVENIFSIYSDNILDSTKKMNQRKMFNMKVLL